MATPESGFFRTKYTLEVSITARRSDRGILKAWKWEIKGVTLLEQGVKAKTFRLKAQTTWDYNNHSEHLKYPFNKLDPFLDVLYIFFSNPNGHPEK